MFTAHFHDIVATKPPRLCKTPPLKDALRMDPCHLRWPERIAPTQLATETRARWARGIFNGVHAVDSRDLKHVRGSQTDDVNPGRFKRIRRLTKSFLSRTFASNPDPTIVLWHRSQSDDNKNFRLKECVFACSLGKVMNPLYQIKALHTASHLSRGSDVTKELWQNSSCKGHNYN